MGNIIQSQHVLAKCAQQSGTSCVVIPLVACASDNSLSTNQSSAVSLAPPFRYQTTKISTLMEGSQNSGKVQSGNLVPFTTSENCVPSYCVQPTMVQRRK